MTDGLTTGADFGRATASWFGLDVNKVSDVRFSNPLREPLTVTITIQINPDDVTGIGKRMKEMAACSNGIVEPVAPRKRTIDEFNRDLQAQLHAAGLDIQPRNDWPRK
jgi:hypothetical protein